MTDDDLAEFTRRLFGRTKPEPMPDPGPDDQDGATRVYVRQLLDTDD